MWSYEDIKEESQKLQSALLEDNSGSILRPVLFRTLALIERITHELEEDRRYADERLSDSSERDGRIPD